MWLLCGFSSSLECIAANLKYKISGTRGEKIRDRGTNFQKGNTQEYGEIILLINTMSVALLAINFFAHYFCFLLTLTFVKKILLAIILVEQYLNFVIPK